MISENVFKIKESVHMKMYTFIVSAFALVAALAWNTAIQDIFNKYYTDNGSIYAKLIYAFVVTIIAIIITTVIGKWVEKK